MVQVMIVDGAGQGWSIEKIELLGKWSRKAWHYFIYRWFDSWAETIEHDIMYFFKK
ncbi:hypothetical protein DESC_770060 [Desulfosarcina cetonica]|nr:hypothetical protein DESC_770060 [Desulfosarcina cetonica]